MIKLALRVGIVILVVTLNGLSQQWTPFTIIDTTTINLEYQQSAITDVAPDGTVGVVWQEITTDRRNPIVFLKSADRGQTFQKSIVIDSILKTHSGFQNGEERYVHDFKFGPDGTIWVLWSYFKIYDFYDIAYLRISKSSDGGLTFNQVFNSLRASTTFIPRFAIANDGSVYLLWDDNQFTCTRFLHGDMNVSSSAEIPNGNYIIDYDAGIAIDSLLNIYVVWNGHAFDSSHRIHEYIFCSTSIDSGRTFESSVRIDTSEMIQATPNITISNSNEVFIIYSGTPGFYQDSFVNNLYVTTSTNGGFSFNEHRVLMDSVGGSPHPSVIYNKDIGLFCVWYNNNNTFYTRSTDQGVTFQSSRVIDSTRTLFAPILTSDWIRNIYCFSFSRIQNTLLNAVFSSMMNVFVGIGREIEFERPKEFQLFQNYPNPFNPITVIRYSLPTNSLVTLKVYNTLGEEVGILVNGLQDAGYKSVEFNANALPSGVYFYRMMAIGENGATTYANVKKMLLVR